LRDVVKHSEELARLAADAGAAASLVEYVASRATGPDRLPGTIALGFLSAYSESMAQEAVDTGAVAALKEAMLQDAEPHLKAACVWSLGQIGKHTPSHARALALSDVFRHVLALLLEDAGSEDLRDKCQRCLRAVIAQCDHVLSMQPLLETAPAPILHVTLRQIRAAVTSDGEQRKAFLASSGLKVLQTLDMRDPDTADLVDQINQAYPAEVVAFCRPDYLKTLAEKVGQGMR
jgi:hypothetical protein